MVYLVTSGLFVISNSLIVGKSFAEYYVNYIWYRYIWFRMLEMFFLADDGQIFGDIFIFSGSSINITAETAKHNQYNEKYSQANT